MQCRKPHDRLTRNRTEVKELRAELKDRDPQLWEMAERITELELKVISLGGKL